MRRLSAPRTHSSSRGVACVRDHVVFALFLLPWWGTLHALLTGMRLYDVVFCFTLDLRMPPTSSSASPSSSASRLRDTRVPQLGATGNVAEPLSPPPCTHPPPAAPSPLHPLATPFATTASKAPPQTTSESIVQVWVGVQRRRPPWRSAHHRLNHQRPLVSLMIPLTTVASRRLS